MADYTPVNSDNAAITLTAGAAITGGLLVSVNATNDTVVHTTQNAAYRAIGVAAHDAPSGGRVTVYVLPGFVHELPVEQAIMLAAGDGVVASLVSTTAGRITTTTFATTNLNPIGVCIRGTTGTAAGAKARFIGL